MLLWLLIREVFIELQTHRIKMSHEGKLRRGEAYFEMRDKEGNYPRGVTDNPTKMSDLNYFLESQKKSEGKEDKKKTKGEE